jgi:hypothetical protein
VADIAPVNAVAADVRPMGLDRFTILLTLTLDVLRCRPDAHPMMPVLKTIARSLNATSVVVMNLDAKQRALYVAQDVPGRQSKQYMPSHITTPCYYTHTVVHLLISRRRC